MDNIVQVRKIRADENTGRKISIGIALLFLLVLIANIALTVIVYNIISTNYPGRSSQFNYKHYVATKMLDNNRQLAADLEVADRANVKKALADFTYDIEISSSRDELAQIILYHPYRVNQAILQEWELMIKDKVLELVNSDQEIRKVSDNTRFTMRVSKDNIGMEPYNVLSASTEAQIKELFADDGPGRELFLDLEAQSGELRIASKDDPEDYISILTEEINSLRVALRDLRSVSGFSEMTGSGIVVMIYDQDNASDSPAIVHDTDIRDVVNELFAAGATGIAVGGQRLTATTSIRCTGPLVKVDDRLVAVNPVEIKVLGDPDLLAKGMDIMKNTIERDRGLTFEINKVDTITLPAYTPDS